MYVCLFLGCGGSREVEAVPGWRGCVSSVWVCSMVPNNFEAVSKRESTLHALRAAVGGDGRIEW